MKIMWLGEINGQDNIKGTTWNQSENWEGRVQMRETGTHAELEQCVQSHKCSLGTFVQLESTITISQDHNKLQGFHFHF